MILTSERVEQIWSGWSKFGVGGTHLEWVEQFGGANLEWVEWMCAEQCGE